MRITRHKQHRLEALSLESPLIGLPVIGIIFGLLVSLALPLVGVLQEVAIWVAIFLVLGSMLVALIIAKQVVRSIPTGKVPSICPPSAPEMTRLTRAVTSVRRGALPDLEAIEWAAGRQAHDQSLGVASLAAENIAPDPAEVAEAVRRVAADMDSALALGSAALDTVSIAEAVRRAAPDLAAVAEAARRSAVDPEEVQRAIRRTAAVQAALQAARSQRLQRRNETMHDAILDAQIELRIDAAVGILQSEPTSETLTRSTGRVAS